MASSSIVLNRIFKSEGAELKDMFSKIIEEQMKKTTEDLKKVAESKISEDLAKFYSGSFDTDFLQSGNGFSDGHILSEYSHTKYSEYHKIVSISELQQSNGFLCNFKAPYDYIQYWYVSKKFIFIYSRDSRYNTIKIGLPVLHKIPLNILYGIRLFYNLQQRATDTQTVYSNPMFISDYDYKMMFANCAEFETICKQEEEERKAMMETLEKEREEFESEKEQFYSIMTDYNEFQEEKKKFAEEKRKLSLVKLALEREKDKLKKEREEFEQQKRELELLKSAEIDLDAYFEQN